MAFSLLKASLAQKPLPACSSGCQRGLKKKKKKPKYPSWRHKSRGRSFKPLCTAVLEQEPRLLKIHLLNPSDWWWAAWHRCSTKEGTWGCQSMGQLETDMCRQPGWEIPSKILTPPGNFRSSSLAGSTAQNPTNLDTHYPQVSSICLMVEWEQEPKHALHCGQFSKQVLRNWTFPNL